MQLLPFELTELEALGIEIPIKKDSLKKILNGRLISFESS